MRKIFFGFAIVVVGLVVGSHAHAQVGTSSLTVGSRVITTAALNVRSLPNTSGTLLGTEAAGSYGTIVGGPQAGSGYMWWNIHYDDSVNGWSVANYLSGVATSTPPASGSSTISVQAIASSSYVAGQANARIASFLLVSPTSVSVNTITIFKGGASSTYSPIQNLRVLVNGLQFGTTQSTVSNNTSYLFAGSVYLPATSTPTRVDVMADILASTAPSSYLSPIAFGGCSAYDSIAFAAVPCVGQAPTGTLPVWGLPVSILGQAAIQVAIDATTPAAQQVVMGSTGNALAAFRFSEVTNGEDVKVTDLNVFQQVAATSTVKSAFSNLQLYKTTDLSTTIGSAGSAQTSLNVLKPGYYYTFHFANPVLVPKGNSVSLVLKGDVASFSSSGATDNSTHVFKIATSTDFNNTASNFLMALGNTSNQSSSVTLGTGASQPTGNPVTIMRTKLTLSTAALGATVGRLPVATDNLGTLTFTADPAGVAVLNKVTVTFYGTAPATSAFLDGASLIDQNGSTVNSNNYSGLLMTTTTPCTGSGACSKSWYFGSRPNGFQVNGGTSYQFTLRADSTKIAPASSGVAYTLTAYVDPSVTYYNSFTDGVDTGAAQYLPFAALSPTTIASVAYASGAGGGTSDTTPPVVQLLIPTSHGTIYTTTSSVTTLGATITDPDDAYQAITATWQNSANGTTGQVVPTIYGWAAVNVPLMTGTNVITYTARDAAGNTGTDSVTIMRVATDVTSPTIQILVPNSLGSFITTSTMVNIGAAISDPDDAYQAITATWRNSNTGQSGLVIPTIYGWWGLNIPLNVGVNAITITAHDAAGNTSSATFLATRSLTASAAVKGSIANILDALTSLLLQLQGSVVGQ